MAVGKRSRSKKKTPTGLHSKDGSVIYEEDIRKVPPVKPKKEKKEEKEEKGKWQKMFDPLVFRQMARKFNRFIQVKEHQATRKYQKRRAKKKAQRQARKLHRK